MGKAIKRNIGSKDMNAEEAPSDQSKNLSNEICLKYSNTKIWRTSNEQGTTVQP